MATGLVVGGIIGFGRNPGPPPLPAYLDRWIPEQESLYVYHSHLILTIIVQNQVVPIPGNIGASVIDGASYARPVHTHSFDTVPGTLHIETDENRDYTLGDFFLVWGKVFNEGQVLDYKADTTHKISMTVNGATEPRMQNYVLPRDAETSQWGCALGMGPPPGGCHTYNIVITYSTI